MTPKDIEITLVALLKSTIEAQTPREEWGTALSHAVELFRAARDEWASSEPSGAVPPPGGAASYAPRSAGSGPPSPSPSSGGGLPVYVVVSAQDPGETKNGKKFRTLVLRNDQGDEQKVGFFESKYDAWSNVSKINAGDQITASIETRGEYVNGNKPRVVKAAPVDIPF